MNHSRIAIATVFVAGLLAVGCCKKKPGDSCSGTSPSCLDENNLLVCEKGTLISTPCKGPNGCKVENNLIKCDISGNAAGDPCSSGDEGDTACGVDGKSQISCHSGKYEVALCRGPDGCKTQGNTSICDLSIAEEGQECKGPGAINTYACSVDGSKVLKCTNGQFNMSGYCRGKKCEVKDGKVGCPDPIALVNDPCDTSSLGSYACAVDGSALLVCRGSKWIVDEKCRGKTKCKEQNNQVGYM